MQLRKLVRDMLVEVDDTEPTEDEIDMWASFAHRMAKRFGTTAEDVIGMQMRVATHEEPAAQ